MALRNRSRAPVRGTGFRPATRWAGFILPTPLTVAPLTKILVASFPLSGDEGETLRRTRGVFAVVSDVITPLEDQVGSLGMGVFSNAAIAAGVASLPDPVTDIGDDIWALYLPVAQRVGSSFTNFAGEFDSKAMRKVVPGYSLGVIIANASPTFGFILHLNMRVLSSVTSA